MLDSVATESVAMTNTFIATLCMHPHNFTELIFCRNKGLTSGMNVIDTSSNYMDGLSEKLIGNVLEGLIENNEIKRDVTIHRRISSLSHNRKLS